MQWFMQNIAIKLLKIGASNFSLRDKDFDLRVNFEVNGKSKVYYNHYKLSNPEIMTERVLKEIKEKEKTESEKDAAYDKNDVLANLKIISFQRLDETEMKLTNFFGKVDNRIKQFKNVKSSENYISNYDRFKDFEVQLF